MNTYYTLLIVPGYKETKVKAVKKKMQITLLVLMFTIGGREAKHIQTDITLRHSKRRYTMYKGTRSIQSQKERMPKISNASVLKEERYFQRERRLF